MMNKPMRFPLLAAALVVAAISEAPLASSPGSGVDAEAQEQTFETMRVLGEAVLNWYTDNVSSWPPARIDVADYQLMSHGELAARLVPIYIDNVPSYDGWGNRFEFYLPGNSAGLLADRVMLIRSTGRDRQFDSNVYNPGSFSDQQYDRDLVWADGYFIRWPRRLCQTKQPEKGFCRIPPVSP